MATQNDLIQRPNVVSHDQWVAERVALLAKEKEHTRLGDELSRQRRELPWEKVTKSYVFDGSGGKVSLGDLFEGRPQLIIYHFMFDPAWDTGCKSCSFVADNFSGALVHLTGRDTSFAVISRAPLDQIERFKQRMGWSFPWLSSFGTDFNHDFRVTTGDRQTVYNYAPVADQPAGRPLEGEREGLSVFFRDGGRLFHTYSAYQRGLDSLLATYSLLDLTPLGRHEDGRPMSWLKYHDQYPG